MASPQWSKLPVWEWLLSMMQLFYIEFSSRPLPIQKVTPFKSDRRKRPLDLCSIWNALVSACIITLWLTVTDRIFWCLESISLKGSWDHDWILIILNSYFLLKGAHFIWKIVTFRCEDYNGCNHDFNPIDTCHDSWTELSWNVPNCDGIRSSNLK